MSIRRVDHHAFLAPPHHGFVERLQQTILHAHWRGAFRRAYFTDRVALQRTLQRFMRLDNCERPHHGYCVRGRTPAWLVFGARAAVAR